MQPPTRDDIPAPFATTNAALLAANIPQRDAHLYCADCLVTHHLRAANHEGPHGARPSPLGTATIDGWESSVGPGGGWPTPYSLSSDPFSHHYTGGQGVGHTRSSR